MQVGIMYVPSRKRIKKIMVTIMKRRMKKTSKREALYQFKKTQLKMAERERERAVLKKVRTCFNGI